jgi:hypothetical protein
VNAPSPLRFLVAPDSFKGTFSAPEVADAIAAGLREAGAEADLCPVADGGEGTAQALRAALGGETRRAPTHDPLGRPLEAEYVLLADGATAALDTAAASGLPLVAPAERDAEAASTRGSGELIAAAIEAGASRVIIAAGGSATTDGGRGAIEALRERGGSAGATIEVLCDVTTPFEDAARVFAPQKGADEAAVARLTQRLDDYAAELPRDPRGVPMSGCAGASRAASGRPSTPACAPAPSSSSTCSASSAASTGPTLRSAARAGSTRRAWKARSSAKSPSPAPGRTATSTSSSAATSSTRRRSSASRSARSARRERSMRCAPPAPRSAPPLSAGRTACSCRGRAAAA